MLSALSSALLGRPVAPVPAPGRPSAAPAIAPGAATWRVGGADAERRSTWRMHAAAPPAAPPPPVHAATRAGSSTVALEAAAASAPAQQIAARASTPAALLPGAAAFAGAGAGAATVMRDAATAARQESSSGGGAGPSGGGGGGDGNEFNLNFGEAIVTLREDLPVMFERDLRWHIYRDDITFTLGSLGGAHLSGISKYKWLHRSVRALTWLLYSDVRLATLRMWEGQADRRQLRVRWCVMARSRLPFLSSDSDEALRFEAISTYKFDSRGRIYEHHVDKIIPPESPVARWIETVIRVQGAGAPAPAPAPQQPGIPIPGGGGGGWREQL